MTVKRTGWTIIALALIVVIISLVPLNKISENDKSITETGEMVRMDIKELESKVLDKNWDALDIVDTAAAPAGALPLLVELSKNDDPEVREIALNCVAMIKDAGVPAIIAGALSDEDDDIRSFAMQALQTIYDESISDALVGNLANDDADVRSGAALLLGQIGQSSAAEPIEKRLAEETDGSVERNLKLALAKLGSADLKAFFADQMDAPDSEVRLQGLEDLRYIGDSKLAVRILPALDDTGQAHLITDKNQPEPEFARVCDAAVNLISELCGRPFEFEVDEFKVYSDGEIEQARTFLRTQMPE